MTIDPNLPSESPAGPPPTLPDLGENWAADGPAKGIRVRLPLAIAVVAVVALLGIFGGAQLKSDNASATVGARRRRGTGRRQFSAGSGGRAAEVRGGGGSFGTVQSVNGNTITITDQQGQTKDDHAGRQHHDHEVDDRLGVRHHHRRDDRRARHGQQRRVDDRSSRSPSAALVSVAAVGSPEAAARRPTARRRAQLKLVRTDRYAPAWRCAPVEWVQAPEYMLGVELEPEFTAHVRAVRRAPTVMACARCRRRRRAGRSGVGLGRRRRAVG